MNWKRFFGVFALIICGYAVLAMFIVGLYWAFREFSWLPMYFVPGAMLLAALALAMAAGRAE